MPAQLVALTDGPSILLDKPILLVGRHPECDIQIQSRKVSRRHCCIAQVGEDLLVRDLGSTNGVRVNGVRVVEGRLKVGDELTIGNNRYQVRWDSLTGSVNTKSPLKQPARQPAVAKPGIEDLLESWDEPVPLAEPVEGSEKDSGDDIPMLEPPPAAAQPNAPAVRKPGGSAILPEDIELAPASDVIPNPLAGKAPSDAPANGTGL